MKVGILFFVVVLCCCLHIQECLQPRGGECSPKGRVCRLNGDCCSKRCRSSGRTCRGQCNAETCKEALGMNRPNGRKCDNKDQCVSNICEQPNEKRCSGQCPCFFQ